MYSHVIIDMHLPALHIPQRRLTKFRRSLPTHPEHAGKHRETMSRKSRLAIQRHAASNDLQPLVFWPGTPWLFESVDLHVYEAGIEGVLFEDLAGDWGYAESLGAGGPVPENT